MGSWRNNGLELPNGTRLRRTYKTNGKEITIYGVVSGGFLCFWDEQCKTPTGATRAARIAVSYILDENLDRFRWEINVGSVYENLFAQTPKSKEWKSLSSLRWKAYKARNAAAKNMHE